MSSSIDQERVFLDVIEKIINFLCTSVQRQSEQKYVIDAGGICSIKAFEITCAVSHDGRLITCTQHCARNQIVYSRGLNTDEIYRLISIRQSKFHIF
ncbi:uncharacterized protein MELLADRAFT_87796 [Melampsora larici-populina 98AG31]|uniref:Uncharacterized protein n=1 Tax=Melampsora larici-populina (strain 98AG31 / pathotype 3-4-7) TaxID=747676 RepID=F4RPH8_MELLP|nr:uncharacterized protein MELLADRAFT_87796 [Melampsora larici-populina 98AG31]EGG05532.1 hypothetical protein MELLADRAFT_87796 [Melampsora larici-populina 98AG31]